MRLFGNLVRENYVLTQPIYAKRDRVIRRIPNFWAIVMEEAPEEIDRRIQPCDTSALSALQSIDVTRFEVSANAPHVGEPRSVKIGLEFGENAWFTDRRLEKTFWHRRAARDGWTGLVSEPVRIRWKEGKDLTEGLLDDAVCIFELGKELKKKVEHQAGGHGPGGQHQGQLSTLHQQHVQNLVEKLQRMPQDAVSFFAWFGYRGREVSAEESAEAIQREEKDRQRWKNTDNAIVEDGHEAEDEKKEEGLGDAAEEEEEEEEEGGGEGASTYDIYPAGEDLAIAISEDLFPGAIKYFSEFTKASPPPY